MGQSWNQPLSRRNLLAGAAGGVAFAGLAGRTIFAHGSHGDGGSSAAGAAPDRRAWPSNVPTPREQTVVFQMVGTTENFDNFNPFVPNGETIQWGVHQAAREPFFIQNLMTGELVPWLATEYTYNDDFTALTVKFNPDATWSDGEPFTSEDVLFTFETLAANEALYGNSDATYVTGIETPDAQTITFGLPEPRPRWHLNFLAIDWSQWIRVVPKHIWEGEDPETFTFNPPIYTGPYTLVDANPQTLMYVWEKSANYWNTELEFAPQYLVFSQELPIDARLAEFESGAVDCATFDYLNQQALLANYQDAVTCTYPDPCPRALLPNNLSPLFQHPEARWALSLLTNREVIASTIMQPPTEPAQYPWPSYATNDIYEVPELAEQYDLTEFNPEKAGELLDSIGVTRDGDWRTLDGEALNVSVITSVPAGTPEYQTAELVVEEARKIGLNMELVNLQGATFDAALKSGDYDVQSGWMCPGNPPAMYGNWVVDEEAGDAPVAPIGETIEDAINVERIDVTELLPLSRELAEVPADAVDNPAFAEALEVYFQHLPMIPTVQTLMSFMMNTRYWTGWPTDEDAYATPKFDLQPFIITLSRLRPAE